MSFPPASGSNAATLPQPTFETLQFSPEAWTKYRSEHKSDSDYGDLGLAGEVINIQTVGYGESAQKVLKEAKELVPDEVGDEEDVRAIIYYLEDAIRIPSSEWVLAVSGAILQPDTLILTHVGFNKETVKLTLVPRDLISRYLRTSTRTVWKTLSAEQSHSEAAEVAFHLISTQDEDRDSQAAWRRYMAYRLLAEERAEKIMKKLTEPFREDQDDQVLQQVRNSITGVLKDCTELTEFEQESIADGVLPLSMLAEVDELNMERMEIISRVHSPTRPTAIDIHWEYNHRSYSNHVKFNCRFLYRILDPMSSPHASVDDTVKSTPKPNKDGWKLLFEISLEPLQPGKYWRPVYATKWGLSSGDADDIYTALFGSGSLNEDDEEEDEDDWPSYVDDVNTIRLLLAAGGVFLHIARLDDDEDGDRQDRMANFQWNFEQEAWIGKNIRAACGESLQRDAAFKEKTYARPDYDDEDSEEDEDVPDSDEESEGDGDY